MSTTTYRIDSNTAKIARLKQKIFDLENAMSRSWVTNILRPFSGVIGGIFFAFAIAEEIVAQFNHFNAGIKHPANLLSDPGYVLSMALLLIWGCAQNQKETDMKKITACRNEITNLQETT